MAARSKRVRQLPIVLVAFLCAMLAFSGWARVTGAEGPNAVVTDAGCNANALAANDDGSSPQTALGFTINFFGTTYTKVYANNNGNVTFDAPLSTYTATPIQSAGKVIIAPYWADVDTRGTGNNTTKYGPITYGGRPAFCVNWINVGYYNTRTDKLNSFQLILQDRSDTGANNFDIIMNYDKIQWETGGASGGTNGLGGNSARVGYSNGSNSSFELPGSAVNGAFLDSNATTALIKNSRNSNQLGRYIYQVRNGTVQPPVSPSPSASPGGGPACLSPAALDFGTQIIGGNAPSQLALLNNCGTAPLTITATTLGGTNPGDFEISSSCAGTTIAVGASCGIRVIFHPAATGARKATVTVTFAGGTATLALSGVGDVPHPPFNLTVLLNGPCASVSATVNGTPNPGPYATITTVTLTPNPSPGATFIYWKSERGFMGWADPWTFDMNADHTITAYCVPTPAFPDYTPSSPTKNDPLIRLAALQILRGQDGQALPVAATKRAQMAALIARGMGYDRAQTWDQENHGNTFPDQSGVDDALWRNVGTLFYYNVARGFQDGTYQPLLGVLYAQTISFITRSMVLNGYWVQKTASASIYPNVLADSGHRDDIATFLFYTNTPLPGTSSTTQIWSDWDKDAPRAWFAQAEWLALNSYFGVSSRFAP